MKLPMILAHGGWLVHLGGVWGFVALVLLILFVTLIVTEGSRNKDK